MARKNRYYRLFLAVHATAHAVDGCDLFENDEEKLEYLIRFVEIARQEQVEIHAYCLLSNHVHFILVPLKVGSLSRLFLRVHTWWAQYINLKRGRKGHLFAGRFYSCVLDKAHYWAAMRYIDANPRHHNVSRDLVNFRYSSARQHLTGQEDPLVPLKMGAWRRRFTIKTYREFVEQTDTEAVKRLDECLQNGMPCGSEKFVRRLERKVDRRLHALPRGRPRKVPQEQPKTFTA